MALPDNALTTVAALRQWLTQDATAETDGRLAEPTLEALIARCSSAIEAYCDRTLRAPAEPQTYVFDGAGGTRLVLPDWPVVELLTVTVNDEPVPERGATGIGYVLRAAEAWIDLIGYSFTRGVGNVVIVARLGYDATLAATDRRHRRALDDLEQASLHLARYWFEKPAAARLTGGVEGRPDSYEVDLWPAEVKGLLAPYRRLGA